MERIDCQGRGGRDLLVCDSCWQADRHGSVIVPGPVTARCDSCDEFVNPRELAVRRVLVKEIYQGVCQACDDVAA